MLLLTILIVFLYNGNRDISEFKIVSKYSYCLVKSMGRWLDINLLGFLIVLANHCTSKDYILWCLAE